MSLYCDRKLLCLKKRTQMVVDCHCVLSDDKDVVKAVKRVCAQTRCVATCLFDLYSRGHVSSVWIQLGCQEADKVSVVSRAAGSDQLWASRAVRELCLYLFPATDGSVCLNRAVHNLLCLSQVMPAVAKKSVLQEIHCC